MHRSLLFSSTDNNITINMPASSSSTTNHSKNPLRGAVEVIPDRLYYCALKSPPSSDKLLLRNRQNEKVPVHCFCMDDELIYWNFFLDFGPLNLGQLYRFTVRLNHLLTELDEHVTILFYSSTEAAKRTNAIYLICAWQILELKRSPEQAYYGFSLHAALDDNTIAQDGDKQLSGSTSNHRHHHSSSESKKVISAHSRPPPSPLTSVGQATIAPLPPFHDASPCACTYELTIMHCLQGLQKARHFNFFDWDTFDVDEYEHYEQVENGDLNWIIQDKIMAFAGPSFKKTVSPEGYCTLSPADYIPYFKKKNVALVVRLNKKMYEEQDFIKEGISHLDQFYLDGSCPPMKILQKVLSAFEAVPPGKAFAVHCKAGLGRTGTCIGAYMMKHYRMTAPEVIAWMRICRPGCVIGPQQQFLQDLEPVMWQEGEMMQINPSIKSRNDRKKSSGVTKIITSGGAPQTDAVSGRPGQADGLLGRRRRQSSKDRKPVPITPDSISGKRTVKSS